MHRLCSLKAESLMTRDVVAVSRETSIRELRELFEKYDFNCFPVLEDGELVGVVTKIDFLKIFNFDPTRLVPDLKSIMARKVEDIMERSFVAVCPDESIQDVSLKMLSNRVSAVFVTDKSKKKLLGVLTRGDIVKCTVVTDED